MKYQIIGLIAGAILCGLYVIVKHIIKMHKISKEFDRSLNDLNRRIIKMRIEEIIAKSYIAGVADGIRVAKEHPDEIRLITPKEN